MILCGRREREMGEEGERWGRREREGGEGWAVTTSCK